MPLKDVFDDFRKSKATLEKIHHDTVQYFTGIARKLSNPRDAAIAAELSYAGSPPTSPDEVKAMALTAAIADIDLDFDWNLADLLYTPQEKKEVTSLFSQDQEPALIFVGQTNCGKSSIINELLGCKALPTSDQPSTARIVRVAYAEEPFCRLVAKDGRTLEEIPLKGKNKIPRRKIELNQKDRGDASKVEATVETGLNIDFLKSGVTIIDSPGRNENKALDNLVKEKLENPLAFVIYVVDGHNLFTKQDREVLSEMTSLRPELPIFFVVSKLEPEDRAESSDEDEEASATASKKILEVQSRKKHRVYERLVKYGHLSTQPGVTMDENERFHGLSAWRIQRYKEMKERNPNASSDEFTEYIEAFKRFQDSLKKFAEECLRARIEHVCQILIRVLSRCLDFFIQKANVLKKGKKLMMKTLQTLLREEQEVHDNICNSLDNESNCKEIQTILSGAFENARDGILKEAENFEYDLTEFNVPQHGFVKEKAAVAHCQDQLQRMVVNKLQGEIKVELSMMFRSRELFFTKLRERIERIEEEIAADGEVPSPAVALGRSLLSSYEAQIKFRKRDGTMLHFIKKVATWFYEVICDPVSVIIDTVTGKVEVGSKKWKTKVALKALDRVNPTKMAMEIVRDLKAHFSTCHQEFIGEIEKVQGLFDRGKTIKDEHREKILEFSPNLALQEMLVYGVMDRFRFGLPRQGELIGTGAQGSVFACDNITTPSGNPCVVKVVKVASEEVLKDLTLELHNTRYEFK